MKEEILFRDILREVDNLILKYDLYFTFKNLKKRKKDKKCQRLN